MKENGVTDSKQVSNLYKDKKNEDRMACQETDFMIVCSSLTVFKGRCDPLTNFSNISMGLGLGVEMILAKSQI